MAFITNFQSPIDLDGLVERYRAPLQQTNLDIILGSGAELGDWTVDREAHDGDAAYFMCAKTSVDHMAHLCVEAERLGDAGLLEYARAKRELHRKFAGKILGVGALKGEPFASDAGWAHAHWKSPWYATIADFRFLASPVDISEFRDFVKVSRTGAITRLSGDQAAALAELVRLRNPRVRL